MNYSQRHINAWIMDEEVDKKWLLTCYYGQPETAKRKESWNLLKSFKPQEQDGWCIVGISIKSLLTLKKKGEELDQRVKWPYSGRFLMMETYRPRLEGRHIYME